MRQLPQGTVTFFFSDIEGSTGLVQRLGPDFRGVLERHAAVVRSCLADADATEVRTEGDSFFVVFASAAEAVTTACRIQDRLTAADWPDTGAVRVRIGLHTGEATLGGDDYVGIDVHRAARIGNAGHGGQIVVSAVTRDLCTAAGLPMSFRDLGSHRLRGVEEPIRLYQVDVPGLPVAFPPLRTEASRPNNLPAAATELVGRETELDAIASALGESRVVTLVGPGGVGKTRLALEAAGRALGRHDDGVFLVELASLGDPVLVTATIAATLGVADPEALPARLADRDLLLLVDNFEHVIEAAPELSALLAAAPRLRLLVSSQVPLRIAGERVLPVPPLDTDGAAMRLFVERASAVDPSFDRDADPDAVRELVATLGGFPLALELAAARVALLPPRAILDRITAGHDVAAARSDAPERHRSLTAAITWSVDLLSEGDRAAFARLSVFQGDASFDAAEEVIAGDPIADPLASLAELVDRSLIVRDVTGVSSVRLLMRDPVRRYAAGVLASSGEEASYAERHTDFFCRLGVAAETGLLSDRVAVWLSRLEEELDNLRAVIGRIISAGDAEQALSLLGSTWRFFHSRGRLSELKLWLDRAFALPEEAIGPGRVKGTMALGAYHYWRSNSPGAVAAYGDAVSAARKLGDEKLLGDALFGLATSALIGRDVTTGRAALAEATAIYETLGDPGAIADVVTADAFAVMAESDLSHAAQRFGRAGDLYRAAGRRVNAAQVTIASSAAAIYEGRLGEARDLALAALDTGEDLGDLFLMVWALQYLARIDIDEGRLREGAALAGACRAAEERLGGGRSPRAIGLDDAATRAHELLGSDADEAIAAGDVIALDDAVRLARREVELAEVLETAARRFV